MSRLVFVGWCALAVACGSKQGDTGGEPLTPDETDDPPTTDTYVTPPTMTYTWSDVAQPPEDVDAECWSWSVASTPDDHMLQWLRMYTYDAATLSALSYANDREPDGHMDYVATYTWDAGFQHIVRGEYDTDGDTALDRVVANTYDAVTGLRTTYEEDTDGDGDFDRTWTYTYDGDKLILAEADETGDRIPDTWWRYAYDDQGRTLSISGDDGDDGTIEAQHVYVHEDVAEGWAYTRTFDEDMDGAPELTERYVYDALDRVTHREYLDDEGNHFLYDYTYDENGDVLTATDESTYQGEWNDRSVTTYTYEAPGRVVLASTDIDFTGEGDVDFTYIEETTWFCP